MLFVPKPSKTSTYGGTVPFAGARAGARKSLRLALGCRGCPSTSGVSSSHGCYESDRYDPSCRQFAQFLVFLPTQLSLPHRGCQKKKKKTSANFCGACSMCMTQPQHCCTSESVPACGRMCKRGCGWHDCLPRRAYSYTLQRGKFCKR